MTEVSDLSRQELTALAKVVELWEEITAVLAGIEAYPRDHVLHIQTEAVEPWYLGWIGCNEGGSITFQPAPAPAE